MTIERRCHVCHEIIGFKGNPAEKGHSNGLCDSCLKLMRERLMWRNRIKIYIKRVRAINRILKAKEHRV